MRRPERRGRTAPRATAVRVAGVLAGVRVVAVLVAAAVLGGCAGTGGGPSRAATDGAGGHGDGAPFWNNPEGPAERQAAAYRAAGRHRDAELIERIADRPVAEWLGAERAEAEEQARTYTVAAGAAGRRAVLVLYNIPHRDCGQYSRGGARDAAAYREWLAGVVRGIGGRPATVIVEPDALPHLLQEGCTPHRFHDERYRLLHEAVTSLAALADTDVYLDAGNAGWVREPGALVEPLRKAGVGAADGFALNVANFRTTAASVAYGRELSRKLGGAHFVVDTSRNGNGPADGTGEAAWCNPPGRALGTPPTTRTGHERVDAYLWIKRPGESDGSCGGAPEAGEWFPRYALALARRARADRP
ncbi:glycoside hydrolase family 6 protein [Streptomyces hazeniae]|uniref:glycoside hydrolase family 6 protein n=1 Tax=Streptomyces hazeniae TaxID=3075538 RepID=UPI00374E01CD